MLNISLWNMVGVVVEVLLLYVLLKKFLFKPIKDIQEKRQAMIDGQMQKADAANAEALAFKEQYAQKISGVQSESNQILEDARKQAKNEYDRIVEQANGEAGDILVKAKKNMELEREKAMREMETQVADLALSAASKILGSKTGTDSDLNLYDQFLDKAGDTDDRTLN
ncbi:MAG: F0F1 ATP synthase subunit B [Lachnospiraceae bacterium]|nr:F0F1 ATP synthase subunit B [Lachnospiraceae bacterium]